MKPRTEIISGPNMDVEIRWNGNGREWKVVRVTHKANVVDFYANR